MEYRKATVNDIDSMALLVTKLLGTCNIKSKKTIYESNVEEIAKDINNYYVCTIKNKVIGICGISDIFIQDRFNLNKKNIREILYLVVDKEYQNMGIGTKLLNLCSKDNKHDIIYEAWGDNGKYVNSKFILEKCGYKRIKKLGNIYYKNNDYCHKCVNRNKNCKKCIAEICIKSKST